MTRAERRILLGEIGAAHGIRGEVSVKSYTANPEDIAAYGPLTDERATRTFELKIVRVTPKGVIARVSGVDDRTAAERLCLTRLYVPRSRLPATEDDAFYHEDLIGLHAVDSDGQVFASVTGVFNFGAGDLIEIKRPGETEGELVPFLKEYVGDIDLASGRIVMTMPKLTADDEKAEPQKTGEIEP